MDRFKDFREGMLKKGFNADSSAMFEKSLTATMVKIQETIYSEAISQSAFPIAAAQGAGLTAIEWYKGTPTGEMALIGPKSQDLPHMDEDMERNERAVANYGGTFGWSFIEFERANRQGYDFSGRRGRQSRKVSERTLDKALLSEGDARKPDIKGVFGDVLTATTSLTGNWVAATNDQIISDAGRILQAAYDGSGGEYPPTHLMLGSLNYGVVAYRTNTNTDESLLSIIEKKFNVTVLRTQRFNSVTSSINSLSAAPAAIAYHYDEDLIEVNIPRPFMMRPGEWRGAKYCVDCYLDFAGFFNYMPPAMSVADLS